jgi:hypothetical protein
MTAWHIRKPAYRIYTFKAHDKGKPVVRRGRKATGLDIKEAGLPKGGWMVASQ